MRDGRSSTASTVPTAPKRDVHRGAVRTAVVDAVWIVGWAVTSFESAIYFIPAWLSARSWHVPRDVWPLVRASRSVAAGALGYMYEAGPYTGLPLVPILLS